MSRFVVNPLPNPPTVVFRAGGGRERIKIEVITNGGTVWFSDDINQLLNLKQDGNPGGWFLTGGAPPQDRTDIWIDDDLYATTSAIATEIEVAQMVHVKENASYTPAGNYSDPIGDSNDVSGYDQPETSRTADFFTTLGAALKAIFLPLVLALVFSGPVSAQVKTLTPGMNVIINQKMVITPSVNTYQQTWTEPLNTSSSFVYVLFSQTLYNFTLSLNDALGVGISLPNAQISSQNGQCQLSDPIGVNSTLLEYKCLPSVTGARFISIASNGGATSDLTILVYVNTSGNPTFISNNQCGEGAFANSNNFRACSPADLNMNAVTLPPSGTTSLTNVIDTRGVKELTLLSICTQTSTINVAVYDEDGITQAFTIAVTSAAALTNTLHIGSEQQLQSNNTLVAAQGWLEFPQRALAFSFTNSIAAGGFCTARLFLAY